MYIRRRKTICNYRRNITLNVVHFQSRLSRKKMLLHLSSHFKIASLALIWESTVLRLRANTINQHLRTCVVLYFEVPVGTFGWHFITPQSSFYRGRITLIHCKTTLLATLYRRQWAVTKMHKCNLIFLVPNTSAKPAAWQCHIYKPLYCPADTPWLEAPLKILLEYKTARRIKIIITNLN